MAQWPSRDYVNKCKIHCIHWNRSDEMYSVLVLTVRTNTLHISIMDRVSETGQFVDKPTYTVSVREEFTLDQSPSRTIAR
jgi:hypothetical protein